MDTKQFDALTRALSTRRTALAGLAGGLAALLGLAAPDEVTAHNPAPACRKLKDRKRRRACLRRARAHNRTHQCRPLPPAVVCASVRRCDGVAVDNCGRLINCTCPLGKTCLPNGSCAQACVGDTPCSPGCLCSAESSVEGVRPCISTPQPCEVIPQACTSTAECPVGRFCREVGCDGLTKRCVSLCPA